MHRRTETRLTKIGPYRVFLTSSHWAWLSSENWISCCFMKAFFFFPCRFMNNITMQHYTQDHSFTRDAQGSLKRPAAPSLLLWRRVAIYPVHRHKPQGAKIRPKSEQRLPQKPAPSSMESPWTGPERSIASRFNRAEVNGSLMSQQWQKEELNP